MPLKGNREKNKSRSEFSCDPDYNPLVEDLTDSEVESEENVLPLNGYGEECALSECILTDQEDPESFIVSLLASLIDSIVATAETRSSLKFTKKGTLRKRKKIEVPPAERKRQKLISIAEAHSIKKGCSEHCILKCSARIPDERRISINKQYWLLDKEKRNNFLFSCVKRFDKKRSTRQDSRRKNTFKYYLNDESGAEVNVCKIFLLTTLGYDASNDRLLKTIRDTDAASLVPKSDMRGRHPCKFKADSEVIDHHISSFNPRVSHYRREHAPSRLYLPSDVSVAKMFRHFVEKHPDIPLSYDVYRKHVVKKNISFAKLGSEECFTCEAYKIHTKESKHKIPENLDCEVCEKWNIHKEKYSSARKFYQKDVSSSEKKEGLFVSADLQKVSLYNIFFLL